VTRSGLVRVAGNSFLFNLASDTLELLIITKLFTSGPNGIGKRTMRAPRRKRPLRRKVTPSGIELNLDDIAGRVRYVGSPEHKDTPSFAGLQSPRKDASICDRQLSQNLDLITEWLRAAIRRGAIGGLLEGDFPRYVWHKEGDLIYEARLVNRELGEYKGYPLNKTEWPEGLDLVYD